MDVGDRECGQDGGAIGGDAGDANGGEDVK